MPLSHLIVVAGHASFCDSIREVPEDVFSDDNWVLQSFQAGEPVFYGQHIELGIELARSNPDALLVYSGGRTREESGRWSEAETYRAVAHQRGWLPGDPPLPPARIAIEPFARDSFENLLFSLCVFQKEAHRPPEHLSIVSWNFKRARFDFHRESLRFPRVRYEFHGPNDPQDLDSAKTSEAKTLAAFGESPYGTTGSLLEKRMERTLHPISHPYGMTPGFREFFESINRHENQNKPYPGHFPWEENES